MLRRLLGSTDLLTANIYFHRDGVVRVVWTHHDSTEAGPMIERLWLSAIYFGSVLTKFKGYQDIQEGLRAQVMAAADQFTDTRPGSGIRTSRPLGQYQMAESSSAPVEKHYQTVLYRNRGDSFVNRDKAPLGGEATFAPLSVIAVLASNQLQIPPDALRFLGLWLRGMNEYYDQRSYSELGSSLFATSYGFQMASEEEPQIELSLRAADLADGR